MKNLDKYENMLTECSAKNSESVYSKVADCYEDDLLEFDSYPEAYLHFLIHLLSQKQFYAKPGLWNLLLVVGTENHRLSENEYALISKSIVENYPNYENEDLCLAVCDFIARNYPYSTARKILLQLKTLEANKTQQGFASDGLRILENEQNRKINKE